MKKAILLIITLFCIFDIQSQNKGIRIDSTIYINCTDFSNPDSTGIPTNNCVVTINARLVNDMDSITVDIVPYENPRLWRNGGQSSRICGISERNKFGYTNRSGIVDSIKTFLHNETGISLSKFVLINKLE
ncbi:MAG: hypothetical protein KJ607_03175 [Bacteroidetes bacterium]|nr:hypothetical protein [Bacteroidota bacterium]